MAAASTKQVFEAFSALPDREWLEILLRSVDEPVINGVEMPTFPADEIQIRMHGHADKETLQGAYRFFTEIKAYAAYCGRPIEPHRRLLDFGCGWGRMIRMFMKDIRPQNLLGCEPNPEFVMLARRNNPYLCFTQTEYLPPLQIASESVDYITAFSVFSHLNEYTANRWIEEFRRVLRPGGLVLFTTQGKSFLKMCADFRKRKADGEIFSHPWHNDLAMAFPDIDDTAQRFDRGEFLFAAHARRPPDPTAHYSETIIPPKYVERVWGESFHVVDYFEDMRRLSQPLIVLQKPL